MKAKAKTLLTIAALGMASMQTVQAIPLWGLGTNEAFFNNFENLYRSNSECLATGGCLAHDALNDPTDYSRVDPTLANNVLVGDIFAGIMVSQNIANNGTDIWLQSATDRFTAYFAHTVTDIVSETLTGHITLSSGVDPFGILQAGEQFRFYVSPDANLANGIPFTFESNGNVFDDIQKATEGTFWASAGVVSDGYTYTHSDLTQPADQSNTQFFFGLDFIDTSGAYNLGLLNLVNDPGNEQEVGGTTTNTVCTAAEIADPNVSCTQVFGKALIDLNQRWVSGNSPWTLASNDPWSVNKIPEPTSIALLGIGLLGLSFSKRQRAV